MAKVLKTVAVIAGAVALVATGIGAIAGAAGFLGVTAATWASIGAIAGVVSGVAGIGAQLLTKPPPARGSETKIQIGVEPPAPYLMGEAYSAGVLRHDVAYGATLNKVPNPYRWMVVVASVAGPLTACTPYVDFAPVSGWYSGFLSTDTQLGASPESTALTPPFGAAPGWSSSSKLSGLGAIGWNLKFDKDGKRFASGVPMLGAVWQGVRVYDPRLDSTYPGGSGAHRIDDESTWTYSDNPALHAIAYAYGRYQNGKKVFGIGQPVEGIDLARFVAWANTCDANDWAVSGTIYEPGDRWANLKDIMSAGCAEPVVTGGVLSVRYRAPQVSLATITEDDIADDDLSITAMQTYRNRVNGIVPKYRSPSHNWEFVSAGKVSVPTYVTEDGEEKVEERQWNLVKDVDQVAELAAYALVDARELGPLTVTLKPQWRWVKPGECLTCDFPSIGFDGDAIVLQREIDPGTMKVKLTLIGETEAKHDYALGLTGTPPPTPALGQTAQERDELAAAAGESAQVTFGDPAPFVVQADSAGVTTTDLGGGEVKRTISVYRDGVIQTSGVTVGTPTETPDAAIDTTATVVSGAIEVTLDKADAKGSVVVPVTFDGVTYPRTIVIDRTLAPPVSGGGGGAEPFTDSSWVNISTTSDVQVTDTGSQIQSDGSGQLAWSFNASYTGTGTAICKAQYSTDGSTWSDFDTETTGDPATVGEPGYVSDFGTKTGLTATTVYYVRLIARRQSGTSALSWESPNFSVSQP